MSTEKRAQFRAEGEYPIIGELEQNHHYARMMLDNYGGMVSEMSAIALYIFDDISLHDGNEHIAEIFENIAIVEMHHLHTFGELACKLGQLPILRTVNYNRYIDWSASYNRYPTKLLALLNNALNSELEAISKYEKQMEVIKNDKINLCLSRIIKDEKVHVEIFRKLIRENGR